MASAAAAATSATVTAFGKLNEEIGTFPTFSNDNLFCDLNCGDNTIADCCVALQLVSLSLAFADEVADEG